MKITRIIEGKRNNHFVFVVYESPFEMAVAHHLCHAISEVPCRAIHGRDDDLTTVVDKSTSILRSDSEESHRCDNPTFILIEQVAFDHARFPRLSAAPQLRTC